MARVGDGWLDISSDDDLVEIQVNPPHRRPNNLDSLLNPPQGFSPAQQPVGLRPNRPSDRRATRWDRPPTPARPAVIDLTEEPDSPVEQRPSQSQNAGGRNPRRTNSQRVSPPRLARSDSTLFAPVANVIDLTDDPPEAEPPPRHPRPFGRDQLIELELINSGASFYGPLSRGVQHMAGLLHSEILRGNFNVPQLDITGPFSPREASPKPPMEDVPPTRDGFTRDTCSDSKIDDERVVVCPACNEELAYDPTGTAAQGSTTASGNRKRKRAPGEHHFWALKKCGHVYCADCFENRRPTKAAPGGVGFQSPSGKPPASVPNDLRCAVEGCETKVATKTEWIGIFL
ncbi:cell cycle control protein [Hirsutella rhossiliensis]|uniref:Cell cycle control protein n=1 Tax=Hirsutella rhossiliensis TaxID=111463 RepID=A0A9P8MSL2_9HYPO|nr:cell cycle control protein [Hirsutella rhossiliensis]KAH0961423.1 cell cycle control protein [Hirsutella rhossiliensis]